MSRKSSKDAIFDAAERVILRQGMAMTTIDAVVSEAGLSKGGFFYHFSSKKDLLLQLLERYQKKFHTQRQKIYKTLPDKPGRLLKATIMASIKHPVKSPGNFSNILSLLDDIDMRGKLAEIKLKLFTEMSRDYPHPEKVALAMLFTDGIWLMNIFGYAFPGNIQKKIINELFHLIDLHAALDLAPDAAPDSSGEENK